MSNYCDCHLGYDCEWCRINLQNKRYREALEFYADKEKYFIRMDELELPEDILHAEPRIVYDRGRTARKALERLNDG